MTGNASVKSPPDAPAAAADLPSLAAVARIEAMSGGSHDATRAFLYWRDTLPADALTGALGALARAEAPESLLRDDDLGACLDTLAACSAPDLVADFCNPLVGRLFCRMAGLEPEDAATVAELTGALSALESDRLTGRALRRAEAALAAGAGLAGDADSAVPPPLAAALTALPVGMPRPMALAILAGAVHAAAQPLPALIWGLALSGHDFWLAAAGPDWHRDDFGQVSARVMTLFKTRSDDGDRQSALSRIGDDSPLAAHFDAVARRVIPALAARFPRLYLHRNQARFHGSRTLIAPVALPADVHAVSSVTSSFLIDIREVGLARDIATDNDRFEPSKIAEFFTRVQTDAKIDLHNTIHLAENALFFMVGPRHQRSRKVIMDVMGQNRLKAWQPVIDTGIDQALEVLAAAEEPDIVRDFTEPVLRLVCKPILGLNPADASHFDAIAKLLASLQSPIRSLKGLRALEVAVSDMLEMIETQPSDDYPGYPRSVLSLLLAAELEDFDRRDLVAFVLVLYSGCFNIAHTLANTIFWISLLPEAMKDGIDQPRWTRERVEHIMSTCTSINYIRRVAQTDLSIGGFTFAPEQEARINIAPVNQGIAAGNMTFGHGLRRCVGAALSRLVVRAAIPKLYSRFPDLKILPQAPSFMDLPTSVSLKALKCQLRDPQMTGPDTHG